MAPTSPSPDGGRLYAAPGGSNQVAEIDTADLTGTRRIDLTRVPVPGEPVADSASRGRRAG
jgi:DNA-binding beta-propeller fold protein YncE